MEMEGIVFETFNKRALLKVKNTTPDMAELIYEMPRRVYWLAHNKGIDITEKLYAVEGVEYVNTVTQSDEITG